MAGMLTIAWGAQREPGAGRLFEQLSVAAAALLLTASTVSTILEQSALDREPARAERGTAGGAAATLPGKETLVGAFTGVPYTYPSQVKIGKQGSGTFFTIDPVHWHTDPFHNPIYYGVRVARWGARTGVMVDFIHSKAMARLGEDAAFNGTIDGKPLPAHARIADIVDKMEFSHGHNMLLFNGLLRLPGIGAHLSPYVGAGAGVLLPHAEVELRVPGHTRTYEYNYAGPAGQALAGIEIRLARISLFIEYKFTYGHYGAPLSQMNGSWLFLDLWRQLKRWIDGVEPPGGHIKTEIVSHQVVGGLAVRFAPRVAAP
jgi:lipid A oxidase